jgi:uroporphyrinogen-III decarboxylase
MHDGSPDPSTLRKQIDPLLHRFREAVDSPGNQSRLKIWAEQSFHLKTVKFRGQPLPLEQTEGRVPVQADLYSTGFWGRVLGFDLGEYYTNPAAYLYYYLTARLKNFELIPDDSPLVPAIPVWIGLAFEASLFGAQQVYSSSEEPWVDRSPRIRERCDLDALQPPNFHKSGLMPLAHRFYHELSEMVKGHGIAVQFIDWGASPLNTMLSLRGYETLLVDMMEEPDFVHRLGGFLVGCRKQWERDRAAFTGRPPQKLLLYDDDVSVPQISPALYRNHVLPLEKELKDFYGGVDYWHSCGNVTPFLPSIRELRQISMLNVSAWTDLRRAAELFGSTTTLEICVHAVDDVLQASPQQMESRLREIVQTCREMGLPCFTIRAEGITGLGEVDRDLKQVRQWAEVARKVVDS